MDLPPHARSFFAHKHMDEAANVLKLVSDARRQQSEDNRRVYERFHINLSLISGASIVLSVTFLGYLKTKGAELHSKQMLVGSWACLIACLMASLASVLFNTHYGHYFWEREYYEALRRKLEAEIQNVDEIDDVMNLDAPEEKERFKASRRPNVSAAQRYVEYHGHREKIYKWLWRSCAGLSYVGFVGGLFLLLLFAIRNM